MRTITLETAVAELLRDIHAADHKHCADVETIARAYSAICASPEETICVVAGDKTASGNYLDGRPFAPADFATVAWRIEDIQERMPEWSEKQCKKFLDDNADAIQIAMIDAGGKEIDFLLP